VNSSGVFSPTSVTIAAGGSVTFNYTSGSNEAKVRFSPSTITGFTLDGENSSRTRTFSSAGTWTVSVQDKPSGNTATITVQ
jgi:plastocyanin